MDAMRAARATPAEPSPSPDSATFVVTLLYVIPAAGDSVLRLYQGARAHLDPQLRAALTVCRYAAVLSAGASLFSGPPTASGRALGRWSTLLTISAIPMIVSDWQHCSLLSQPSVVSGECWSDPFYSRSIVVICSLAAMFMKNPYARLEVGMLASFCIVVVTVVITRIVRPGATVNEEENRKQVTMAWPQSAAGWLDLDQAAALGAAILGLLVETIRRTGIRMEQMQVRAKDVIPSCMRRKSGFQRNYA